MPSAMKRVQRTLSTNFKNIGLAGTFGLVLRKIFFWIYKRKFLSCGSLMLRAPYHITGFSSISIGRNFKAGPGFKLEAVGSYRRERFTPVIEIGDNVIIHDYVHIGCVNRVTIGNNVLMASKIYISDHNHGYYDDDHLPEQESPLLAPALRKLTRDATVSIGDNVWIGEFVTILPGSVVGEGSIIGANSVVRGVIPPFSIAAGTPARVVKSYDFENNRWMRCR